MSIKLFSLTLAMLVSMNVYSDTNEYDCQKEFSTPKPILKELYTEVVTFAKSTCQALNQDRLRAYTEIDFLTGGNHNGAVEEVIGFYEDAFPENVFPSVIDAKNSWQEDTKLERAMARFKGQSYYQSDIYELTPVFTSFKDYSFSGPRRERIDLTGNKDLMEQSCKQQGYESCLIFFKDIERVAAIQNSYLKKAYSDVALQNVREISAQWTKFSDNSRFQTPLDVLLTSYIYRKELSDGTKLAPPPPLQYFLLRPSVVIEHLNQAVDGSKDEVGLAVEWFGVNSWDSKIPWGISLASVYADRADSKSIGHGLMFHINNSFSFGFANRGGGDNSIYINIEFMDWFVDKKNKYKDYVN
ncbi:hypothetical protein [Alteromonas abrolhosensis]|uniref:hypothetical protein n=1 Tax=Alteromonas abrolhosensis TaxID=1892904 RepID=UPI0035177297